MYVCVCVCVCGGRLILINTRATGAARCMFLNTMTPIYLHIHSRVHPLCMHANAEIPPPPPTPPTHTDPRISRECEREREGGERERDRMVDFSEGSDNEE
jgi:hypothetical protein